MPQTERQKSRKVARSTSPLRRIRITLSSLALSLLITACTSNRFEQRPPAWGDTLQSAAPAIAGNRQIPASQFEKSAAGANETYRDAPDFFKPGTGVMARPPVEIAEARPQPFGDVKLNFLNANLLEVIKVILGDMLKANYTVDPTVQGVVSMQTTRGLDQDALIPTLELMLRMNNAALITRGGAFHIVPRANALAESSAPHLGDSQLPLPTGYSVKIVPLRYVGAEEMAQILDPLVSGTNQLLRVDSTRNLLILAGSRDELERLLETVRVFDVDRMAGMSVALFTPDFVDAQTLANDLEALLADRDHGLMPGLVRFIVVERLNGLLVVTPRAEHLTRVRNWIRRLDYNTGDANPRLFVYRVQNSKASDLAEVMNKIFGKDSLDKDTKAPIAPELDPVTIGQQSARRNKTDANTKVEGRKPDPVASRRFGRESAPPSTDPSRGIDIDQTRRVQIIADEPNNALLIMARGSEYRQIRAALKQLDVSPMQVLIEVTIAEVTLSDNLSYGVEWFFRNNFGRKTGIGTLDLGNTSGLNPLQPGFSYAIRGGDAVRFVLNTLATESNLSIISSPSLLVLNNQEATIQVGDEVPVSVQQQQSTIADSNIINSIEYRETGVLLTVKPRVNPGGLVIMDVEQEASNVPSTNNADPLTPLIQQRKISSTVAVDSGDTIILGGLIQDNRDRSESGIPIAHKLPILGALFGSKADNQTRTELIVLITPRAISNGTAALQVTEEYRRRLQKLIPKRETPGATLQQIEHAP